MTTYEIRQPWMDLDAWRIRARPGAILSDTFGNMSHLDASTFVYSESESLRARTSPLGDPFQDHRGETARHLSIWGLCAPMSSSHLLPSATSAATFYCERCSQMQQFLDITHATRVAAVCRSTMYYWMDRGWIHWRVLPSGRRIVCLRSLSRPATADHAA